VRLVRLNSETEVRLVVEYAKVRLWAARVRLVERYLASPSLWPDGIDSAYGRWYLGHEDYWREKVGHLVDGGWEGGLNDEAAHALWADGVKSEGAGRPRVVEGEPWVEAGVSRATWYRRKAAAEEGSI
jgi:hypothetical protein